VSTGSRNKARKKRSFLSVVIADLYLFHVPASYQNMDVFIISISYKKLVKLLKNAYLHKSLLQEAEFSAILATCYIGFNDLPLIIKLTNIKYAYW
jgi:hypothetical protein